MVEALAFHHCNAGAIPNFGMLDGMWSPFIQFTVDPIHSKFTVLLIYHAVSSLCETSVLVYLNFEGLKTVLMKTFSYMDQLSCELFEFTLKPILLDHVVIGITADNDSC